MTRKLMHYGSDGHSGVFRNSRIHHDSYEHRQLCGGCGSPYSASAHSAASAAADSSSANSYERWQLCSGCGSSSTAAAAHAHPPRPLLLGPLLRASATVWWLRFSLLRLRPLRGLCRRRLLLDLLLRASAAW